MIVKLTVNIIPELKLNNNTRGIIQDIFYPPTMIDIQPHDMGYNEEQLPIILVEFVKYTCHAMTQATIEAGQSKWIPIVPIEQRCDCGGCIRKGRPLMVAKAASTYCSQGHTYKEGELLIENILFDFTKKAESLWPNVFYYVGCSWPVDDETHLAFVYPKSTSDL